MAKKRRDTLPQLVSKFSKTTIAMEAAAEAKRAPPPAPVGTFNKKDYQRIHMRTKRVRSTLMLDATTGKPIERREINDRKRLIDDERELESFKKLVKEQRQKRPECFA